MLRLENSSITGDESWMVIMIEGVDDHHRDAKREQHSPGIKSPLASQPPAEGEGYRRASK